jgi:hypothetical protein
MPTLTRDQRKSLEDAIVTAREVAEEGACKALEQLGVQRGRAPEGLTEEQASLRNRLRAHGRQLGDVKAAEGGQSIGRLAAECAYEHWHRMLFARFLAESGLLILREPGDERGLALSLDECRELARESGSDWLDYAAGLAQGMLPRIFRADDPVLAVALPPETRDKMEDLLKGLSSDVFAADDALGWTYQFWQAKRKKEVNESEVKIGADELSAVTQLFTEDYMVLFLLHNTLGAWWAGKVLAGNLELARSAPDEETLRAACAVGDISWTYLRFVRDDDASPWRPASGTFPRWPAVAKALTMLDPCMGSGHFLVFALPILVAFRMEEEGLTKAESVMAVLRDNLHGLEIDARCTQIAAFNVALTAWRLLGEHQALPELHLACSGLSLGVTRAEWIKLAQRAAAKLPMTSPPDGEDEVLADLPGRVEGGFGALYDLFEKAPWLGSLIDPNRSEGTLFAKGFDELADLLPVVMGAAESSDEMTEMAVTAQGMAKAAELLGRSFVLVATNVPYLTRNRFDSELTRYCDREHPNSKNELAAIFIERYLRHGVAGSLAVVFPENCLFLKSYAKFRKHILDHSELRFVISLGEEAWETFGIRGPLATLAVFDGHPPEADASHFAINATTVMRIDDKKELIARDDINHIAQLEQRENPDFRITTSVELKKHQLLSVFANSYEGLSTGDSLHFIRKFYEVPTIGAKWEPFIGSVTLSKFYGGRSEILLWEHGVGDLAHSPGAFIKGMAAWGSLGVRVTQLRSLEVTLYTGEIFDKNAATIVPKDTKDLAAVWEFCLSEDFRQEIKRIDKKKNVVVGTMVKIPADMHHWRNLAFAKHPHGLPAPSSDDPTQWLFPGHPCSADRPVDVLQVAMARLLGYRWPRQTSSEFLDCPALGPDGLEGHADVDGVVCLMPLKGEPRAEQRLVALLQDAYGAAWSPEVLNNLLRAAGFDGKTLEDWLRDGFFKQHLELFDNTPFIWHIWDGPRGGFHAFVNVHRLTAGDGEGRRTLERLIYSYLGNWIDLQRDAVEQQVEGADSRLAAAQHLREELIKIVEGEAPYDIFVRWKPLHRQPIGWDPDVDDGVRLNIRPFMTARPLEARGKDACILRLTPKNLSWKKDRGKEPERPREDYPWFWGWDEALATVDFKGGEDFDGNRWNDLHFSNAVKRAARERHA